MLVVTGVVRRGLSVDRSLRRGWINLDVIWSAALIGIGAWMLLS
jgi:hypothetical protein